jgi:membrane complex biogenesis BtpA family protein
VIRGFIGVVHLPPLPGDPLYAGGGFDGAEERALQDAEALAEGGADGIIVENFGSAPFFKGSPADPAPPHQVAALAVIARRCAARFGVPVGVNCLRKDACAALGIAAAAGLSFVRVNVHVGAAVTDQGVIEGDAARTLRYRTQIGADAVALLADVLVKHAVPLGNTRPGALTRDTLERGLADGVIVTGSSTGSGIDLEVLRAVRNAAGDAPVFLGSGVTPENVVELAPLADGAIIGTWLKTDGNVRAPVDRSLVAQMAEALRDRMRPKPLA